MAAAATASSFTKWNNPSDFPSFFSHHYSRPRLAMPTPALHVSMPGIVSLRVGLGKEGRTCRAPATMGQALGNDLDHTRTSNDGGVDDDDVCELVSRLELTLGEGEDAMDAYLVKAMKNNNGAAVLLLTDALGYNDNDTRDFAYRLSCFGYNVLVPDLFGDRPRTQTGEKGGRIGRDMETAASWLAEEIAASGAESKVGLVGFASGGGAILEALARDNCGRFATAVCFYPTGFEPALAAQIQVPLLLICGGNDDRCSPHVLESVAAQTGNSSSRALFYPASGHGFAHAPASVDEDADAESAFVAMKSWLHDKLVVATG